MDIDKKAVGIRIANIRDLQNKTLEEFGNMIDGATKSNVSKWEKGDVLPNRRRLKRIAEIGETSVSELLYGPFENFARNYIERLTYDKEWAEALRFTDEKRQIIIPKALEQVLKKGLAKHFYDFGEFDAVRKSLFDEMSKAAWRIDTETEFTNLGALNLISLDISEMMKHLEEYQDNGVDNDVYSDIEKIIENAHEDLSSLYEKYKDRLKK
nr:helix-turn-helix transcriptional regulator [uncultured Trichococcus sp.]